jgi:DNA-directed RNA polymerase specialized sigma24 family protein
MKANILQEVKAGLAPNLARLWRYGLVLSGSRDMADDLVQATCLRAIERAGQFQSGTHLDRWLFSILRSVWLNELRSRRVREGGGFVDAMRCWKSPLTPQVPALRMVRIRVTEAGATERPNDARHIPVRGQSTGDPATTMVRATNIRLPQAPTSGQ